MPSKPDDAPRMAIRLLTACEIAGFAVLAAGAGLATYAAAGSWQGALATALIAAGASAIYLSNAYGMGK
jgi:hypothetical protein